MLPSLRVDIPSSSGSTQQHLSTHTHGAPSVNQPTYLPPHHHQPPSAFQRHSSHTPRADVPKAHLRASTAELLLLSKADAGSQQDQGSGLLQLLPDDASPRAAGTDSAGDSSRRLATPSPGPKAPEQRSESPERHVRSRSGSNSTSSSRADARCSRDTEEDRPHSPYRSRPISPIKPWHARSSPAHSAPLHPAVTSQSSSKPGPSITSSQPSTSGMIPSARGSFQQPAMPQSSAFASLEAQQWQRRPASNTFDAAATSSAHSSSWPSRTGSLPGNSSSSSSISPQVKLGLHQTGPGSSRGASRQHAFDPGSPGTTPQAGSETALLLQMLADKEALSYTPPGSEFGDAETSSTGSVSERLTSSRAQLFQGMVKDYGCDSVTELHAAVKEQLPWVRLKDVYSMLVYLREGAHSQQG